LALIWVSGFGGMTCPYIAYRLKILKYLG